ncbi:MAG: energy transducer TonB family protein [Halothiobacillaceae bacterium]
MNPGTGVRRWLGAHRRLLPALGIALGLHLAFLALKPDPPPRPEQGPTIQMVFSGPESQGDLLMAGPDADPTELPTPEPAPEPAPEPVPEPEPEPQPEPEPAPEPEPDRPLALRGQGAEISREARLRQEIEAGKAQIEAAERTLYMQRRPKDGVIDVQRAFYLEAWRRQVETEGTRNFPPAVAEQGLSGGPLLEITLLPDGQIAPGGIVILQSTGQAALDEAARETVRRAAPFPPFPDAIRDRYDRMVIVRRIAFESGSTRLTD